MQTSIVQKSNEDMVEELFEYKNKKELMGKLTKYCGSIDKNLKRLVDLETDCKQHKSSMALQIRLDIIKYIDELRGVKPEGKKNGLKIAIFNYNGQKNLDY